MELPVSACGCPVIEDVAWDLVERSWDDTQYYSKKIPMLFHLPIGRAGREAKARQELKAAGLTETTPTVTLLRDGMFSGTLLIAVDKAVPGTEPRMLSLAGATIIAKVATGTRRDVGAAVSSLLSYVRTKAGKHPKAVYFWRIDCPNCAEPPSRRTVILAEL